MKDHTVAEQGAGKLVDRLALSGNRQRWGEGRARLLLRLLLVFRLTCFGFGRLAEGDRYRHLGDKARVVGELTGGAGLGAAELLDPAECIDHRRGQRADAQAHHAKILVGDPPLPEARNGAQSRRPTAHALRLRLTGDAQARLWVRVVVVIETPLEIVGLVQFFAQFDQAVGVGLVSLSAALLFAAVGVDREGGRGNHGERHRHKQPWVAPAAAEQRDKDVADNRNEGQADLRQA